MGKILKIYENFSIKIKKQKQKPASIIFFKYMMSEI